MRRMVMPVASSALLVSAEGPPAGADWLRRRGSMRGEGEAGELTVERDSARVRAFWATEGGSALGRARKKRERLGC